MDDTIKPLADAIYRDKVLRARAAPMNRKMGWGAELYMESCGRMRAGIRAQHPGISNERVHEILIAQLRRLRQLHETGIYQKVERQPWLSPSHAPAGTPNKFAAVRPVNVRAVGFNPAMTGIVTLDVAPPTMSPVKNPDS